MHPGSDEPRGGLTSLARGCDRMLDLGLVAFAAWTLVYQACALLGAGTDWAAAAGALALIPCAWLVLGGRRRKDRLEPVAAVAPRRGPPRWLLGANLVAGIAAAVTFAFTSVDWVVVWILWLLAAACAVAWTSGSSGATADPGPARVFWPEGLVVLAWAAGLAAFSLFVVSPDGDDAYYVHWIAWIAAHGEFPIRDVVYSDRVFPSLYFPPASSFEPLAGTIARLTSLSTPDVVYLLVPPVASFLAVLAQWRLLRTWRVPMVGLALSVALLFVLFDAEEHRMPGAFFIGRMWQGKVLFLWLLVPTLLVLLHRYAARPGPRRLALLAAAGVAAVGFTTTGIFVVPVIAAGCLAPLLLRAPGRALAGIVATSAYPAFAGVVTLTSGGRQPEVYTDADVIPGNLVHFVFGDGVLALLAVGAVLIGPLVLRAPFAGRMIAGAAVLVGVLFSPPLPREIFHLTDLGRVLWRLNWALPAAALLGALATGLLARHRPLLLRAAPAVAIGVAIVAAGQPLWSPGADARVASEPAWKRLPSEIRAAQAILARTRPGDVVLAPRQVSQTVLVLSGTVTTVSPRGFFTKAFRGIPAARVPARLRLQRFAEQGLGGPAGARRNGPEVRRALRVLGVDVACVARVHAGAEQLLLRAGYAPFWTGRRLVCLSAPPRGSRGDGR
jgi:Family of unknown function (DUF6077)